MDTRQLEMFVRVVAAGSFSAAARALHCSQPAISQQMRALERSMGGPLFLRVGRGLQLTEAGRVLAERCSVLLDEMSVVQRHVQAIAALDLTTVRVCAFPSANASLVPRAAAALFKGRPTVRLELSEHEPPDSLELLRRGECDLVIAFSYDDGPEGPDMLAVPLFDDPLVLLLPRTHRLAGAESVKLEELAAERWIAGCPRCRGKFVQVCQDAGFVPDIVCATDDNMAIQGLVSAGLGVSLAPRLVLSFLRHPDLVAVPVQPGVTRRVIAYTWPDLLRVNAIRATVDALQSTAKIYNLALP
jgi:DNA-binding transcriptional LysR family regulator